VARSAKSRAGFSFQEFRSSGVQEFRSSGVQEFRSSGVQEFRSSGVQEFRRRWRWYVTKKQDGMLWLLSPHEIPDYRSDFLRTTP
jgi:hypothetical protein